MPRFRQQSYDDGQYNDGQYNTGQHNPGQHNPGQYEQGQGQYNAGQHNTGQRPRRQLPTAPPNGGYGTGGYERPGYQRDAPPSFAPAPGPPAVPLAQGMGQYGRIMIYSLIEGHADAFDRLAAEVAHAVRQTEPGTLVYACHAVDSSPDQRLFYQLFRDANSVEAHTRQPHVQRFAQEARAHVSGTNVIELTVSAGNIAPQPGPRAEGPTGQPVRWPNG